MPLQCISMVVAYLLGTTDMHLKPLARITSYILYSRTSCLMECLAQHIWQGNLLIYWETYLACLFNIEMESV